MTFLQIGIAIQALSAFLTFVAIIVALFGDMLRARFHLGPEAKLEIELSNHKGYRHGWIDGALSGSSDRIEAHFFRAKITNVGVISADSVSLSLTRLECLSDSNRSAVEDTAMPLRWSDSWSFVMDPNRGVQGSRANTTLPSLPCGASRYWDVFFFYDLGHREELLGKSLRRKQAYFATEVLPSNTYTMTGGRFLFGLHLVALNAKAVSVTYEVDINWEIEDVKSTVRFVRI